MPSIAVAIICKTPMAGFSKTRLSPPLRPEDCAALSECFIRDLAATVRSLVNMRADLGEVAGYAAYTPVGSEQELCAMLPPEFRLLAQSEGDLGARLLHATRDLLAAGHSGAILVNSDSPTLPQPILADAVRALRNSDNAVLSPALDGGYTLIGLTKPHAHLFADIPWSTPQVCRLTLQRAREIALPVTSLAQWYDIDDEYTFRLLQAELAGERLEFAAPGMAGADAPCTRQFLARRIATMPARSLS